MIRLLVDFEESITFLIFSNMSNSLSYSFLINQIDWNYIVMADFEWFWNLCVDTGMDIEVQWNDFNVCKCINACNFWMEQHRAMTPIEQHLNCQSDVRMFWSKSILSLNMFVRFGVSFPRFWSEPKEFTKYLRLFSFSFENVILKVIDNT